MSGRAGPRVDLRALPRRQTRWRCAEVEQPHHAQPCQDRGDGVQPPGLFVVLLPVRQPGELLRVRGLDQHDARDLVCVSRGVQLRVEATERVPDHDVRAGDPGVAEQRVQLAGDVRGVPRPGAGLAPPQTGPVVGAHPGRPRDLLLHQRPVSGHVPQCGVEDHRRAALTDAGDVQPVPTDVDQDARCRLGALGTAGRDSLVDRADAGEQCEHEDQPQQRLTGAPRDRPAVPPRMDGRVGSDLCSRVILLSGQWW